MELLAVIGLFGFLCLTIVVLELFWMWYPFLASRRKRHPALVRTPGHIVTVKVPIRDTEASRPVASVTDKAA